MPLSLRVVLTPTLEPIEIGLKTTSVQVALMRFGSGQSVAAVDSPQAAKLSFFGGFMTEARNRLGPDEFAKLASLTGQVSLKAGSKVPVFEFAPGAALEYEPDVEPGKSVVLSFDSETFVNPPVGEAGPLKLRLPLAPKGARFFELAVELEVAGSVEASQTDNDRLDVLLPTYVAIRVTDEAGTPLAEEPYKIICPSGDCYEGKTDAQGMARVDGVDFGDAQVGVRQQSSEELESGEGVPGEQREGEAAEQPDETQTKTPEAPPLEPSCLEIMLTDEEGRPCAGMPYEVLTPSGQTIAGTLDQEGCARLEGLDPGDCKVRFPDQTGWGLANG